MIKLNESYALYKEHRKYFLMESKKVSGCLMFLLLIASTPVAPTMGAQRRKEGTDIFFKQLFISLQIRCHYSVSDFISKQLIRPRMFYANCYNMYVIGIDD